MENNKKPGNKSTGAKKPNTETVFTVKSEAELLNYLMLIFPEKSRTSLKSLLSHGQVFVNEKLQTHFSFQVKPGDKLSIGKAIVSKKVMYDGLSIVYEDDDLLVIYKQEGLLSISGQNKEDNTAFRILHEHVREQSINNKIFVIHRLDRETSGLMLYAKNQLVQEQMQKSWSDLMLERTYIAVLEGEIEEDKGVIKSWLTEGKTFKVHSSFKPNQGQLAILNYKTLKKDKYYSMVEVWLDTGRKNQIRVQFQAIGHPVVGDKKYGATSNPIKRVALHAKTIRFIHPISKKELSFDSNIPAAFKKLID